MNCRGLSRSCLLPLSAALVCAGAAAATSPYSIGVSQSFGYETNVLRLGTGQPVPEGYSRSDTVSSTALIAGFDQPFGRQRGYANLTLRNNRYSKNSLFNNTSYNGAAGLDWQTIERISGTLTASTSRSLQRFDNNELGFVAQKNLETAEIYGATVSVGIVTQYSFEFAAGHRRVRNSLDDPNVQARAFDQDNASLGIRWRPSSATTLGLAYGRTQGRYPRFATNLFTGEFIADRFQRDDAILTATYRPSGASTIDARINTGKTRYDLNTERNNSALTGAISWVWQATGKVRLTSLYQRDTGQDSYANLTVFGFGGATTTDYSRIVSVAKVQADYDFSAKVAFTSALSYAERSLVRTIATVNPPDARGSDRSAVFTLGARWAPLRSVLVGCDLATEDRRATNDSAARLTSNLRSNSIACYGQFSLQ